MSAVSIDPRARRQEEQENRFRLKMTRWLNPTDHRQRVKLFEADGEPVIVEWGPGEVVEVPSKFDSAIQRIDCGGDACHKGAGKLGGGWFCTKGHNGTIVGGLAPLLKNLGCEHVLDDGLDPDLAKKKSAEADRSAAALAAREAQQALVTAQARIEASGAKVDEKAATVAAASGEPAPETAAKGRPTSRTRE